MWFTLAMRLGQPVQRLQQETTATEFNEWCQYLDIEANTPNKQDYYLAQLAAEFRQMATEKPQDYKKFLFTFKKEKPIEPLTEDEIKRRTQNSKAFWFGMTQVKKAK